MNFWLPLSGLYGWGLAAHRTWLQRFPPQALPVPVVSVGNLTVGGTGKTEAVSWLCRLLLAQGEKPGILSRGYRRQSREKTLIVSRGNGPEVSVRSAGDEPFLLARRWPQAAVVIGADRVLSGRLAVEQLGCTVLVLDDGFQRRDQVARDLDLLLIDAADPFGGDHLLPAGRLREPLAAAAEADAILITRADQYSPTPILARLQTLAPGVPVFQARHKPSRVVPLGGGTALAPTALAGRRLLAVSGIARPEAFVKTLLALGAEVAGTLAFGDHHWYTPADCSRILQTALDLQAEVVTTSKDAVRLKVQGWALEVEFEILPNAHALEALVAGILKGG